MLILGIESSCDETAAAVLEDDRRILADVINSQISVHSKYGGVVPELASRKHIENIYPVVDQALNSAGVSLSEIDLLAVTQGPGLIGCLLVGHSFTKALSFVHGIPCVGVDHLSGHLLSVFLEDKKPEFPYIALVASGGHSSLFLVKSPTNYFLLGRTRDDAAGEAFDKVAKLLDLGYPGGPAISRIATDGNARAIDFPRAWLEKDSLDFSYSGLKTAVASHVSQCRKKSQEIPVEDICASFQEAAVEVLAVKAIQAANRHDIRNIVLAGGVAANPRLRELFHEKGDEAGLKVFMPDPRFCTDNAAMIALAGYYKFLAEGPSGIGMDVYSRSQFLT